jgi:hypothetical protein
MVTLSNTTNTTNMYKYYKVNSNKKYYKEIPGSKSKQTNKIQNH